MPTPHLYGDVTVHGAPTATKDATTPDGLIRRVQLDAAGVYDRNRQNHTGTQKAETISDLGAVLDARITALVNGAPGALDTLGEIAAQLASDETAAGALTQALTALTARVATAEGRVAAHREVTIGDGTASAFTLTHTLGTTELRVEVLDLTTSNLTVYPLVTRPTATTVVVDFAGVIPPANSHRVLLDAR